MYLPCCNKSKSIYFIHTSPFCSSTILQPKSNFLKCRIPDLQAFEAWRLFKNKLRAQLTLSAAKIDTTAVARPSCRWAQLLPDQAVPPLPPPLGRTSLREEGSSKARGRARHTTMCLKGNFLKEIFVFIYFFSTLCTHVGLSEKFKTGEEEGERCGFLFC